MSQSFPFLARLRIQKNLRLYRIMNSIFLFDIRSLSVCVCISFSLSLFMPCINGRGGIAENDPRFWLRVLMTGHKVALQFT